MSARAPLDVDLEDKLLYGLTPIRLMYVIAGMLAGFASWSAHWAPSLVRGVAALLIVGVAATAAWGRMRERPLDDWLIDAIRFAVTNHRLVWHSSFARHRFGGVARRISNRVTA